MNDFFDWTDDALLSISLQFEQNTENVDDYFRQTLAYIQANNDKDDVIAFLKARLKAIDKQTEGKDKKRIVASGLPLASALKLDEVWADIEKITDEYLDSDKTIDDKIQLLEKAEGIMKSMPSTVFRIVEFSEDKINEVRSTWLKGEKIGEIENSSKIISKYFAYSVAWFLGAVANQYRKKISLEKEEIDEEPNETVDNNQKIKEINFDDWSKFLENVKNTPINFDDFNRTEVDKADIFEELAACCELGLPDFLTVKAYLSGIKSRASAIKVGQYLSNSGTSPNTIQDVRNGILEKTEEIKLFDSSPLLIQWLDIMKDTSMHGNKVTTNTFEERCKEVLGNILSNQR